MTGPMRLDFRLTADDLDEAVRPTLPDGRPRRGVAVRLAVSWVVIAVSVGTIIALPRLGPRGPVGPPQNLWMTLVPGLVPAGVFVAATAVTAARQRAHGRRVTAAVAAGRPVPPPPRPQRWTGLVTICPIALLVLWDQPWAVIPWHPDPTTAVWVGLTPWVAALVLFRAIHGGVRRAARRRWATTPSLHRPISAEVSDAGVSTTDGVTDNLYRWPAVVRYRETANLLLLTLEDARVLALPRRAFGGPEAEIAVRGLVQTHVAAGTFLPRERAFPVLGVPVEGGPSPV